MHSSGDIPQLDLICKGFLLVSLQSLFVNWLKLLAIAKDNQPEQITANEINEFILTTGKQAVFPEYIHKH